MEFFVYYMKNCEQGGKKSEKSKRACSSIRDFRVNNPFLITSKLKINLDTMGVHVGFNF